MRKRCPLTLRAAGGAAGLGGLIPLLLPKHQPQAVVVQVQRQHAVQQLVGGLLAAGAARQDGGCGARQVGEVVGGWGVGASCTARGPDRGAPQSAATARRLVAPPAARAGVLARAWRTP